MPRKISEKQRIANMAYTEAYQKENIKRWVIKVNKRTQEDIFDHLSGMDNVQGYIIGLIRDDMDRIEAEGLE